MPARADKATHQFYLVGRPWFFDFYVAAPLPSVLHSEVAKSIRHSVQRLTWHDDVVDDTGTFLVAEEVCSALTQFPPGNLRHPVSHFLRMFSAAMDHADKAFREIDDACEDEAALFAVAIGRYTTLHPFWSTSLDFFRGSGRRVSPTGSSLYEFEALLNKVSRTTLLDPDVYQALLPTQDGSNADERVPRLTEHEVVLLRGEYRVRLNVVNMVRVIARLFGFCMVHPTPSLEKVNDWQPLNDEVSAVTQWIADCAAQVRTILLRFVSFFTKTMHLSSLAQTFTSTVLLFYSSCFSEEDRVQIHNALRSAESSNSLSSE